MKQIFDVYHCRRLTDLNDNDFPSEEPRNECLYYLALIQQEADRKAVAQRQKWQVVRGGLYQRAEISELNFSGQQLHLMFD